MESRTHGLALFALVYLAGYGFGGFSWGCDYILCLSLCYISIRAHHHLAEVRKRGFPAQPGPVQLRLVFKAELSVRITVYMLL